MVFGFLDAASEHAASLAYFHDYALFFLILVIVFVIWLLKMILKFTVFERDLLNTTLAPFSVFGFINFFFPRPHIFLLWLAVKLDSNGFTPKNKFSTAVFDFFYAIVSLFHAGKVLNSYGVTTTIYPDQGNTVNVFSNFPHLVLTELDYRRPYSNSGIFRHYLFGRDAVKSALLTTFRSALHNIPFLFPYERIEVKSYGPYSSVESFIKFHVYTTGYLIILKNAA